MTLISALNIGKSALAVQQAALQVTGNNIANAGNADFTRQSAAISPTEDQQLGPGMFVGTGVNITGISRQIDNALNGRLNSSISDSQSATTQSEYLSRVEATFNELSDNDLSTRMSTFFNSWSNLANKPQDIGLRQVVLDNGGSVAGEVQSMRTALTSLQDDVNSRVTDLAGTANDLAQQVADLNGAITTAEGGGTGTANALRDQRDAAIKQLSQLMDVKVVDQGNGSVNLTIGSEPLVLGTTNRGITTKQDASSGRPVTELIIKADNGTIEINSGELGALTQVRGKIDNVIGQLDSLAKNLIFELNKVHGSGQGLDGFSDVTAENGVNDATAALNDPKTNLKFTPTNGSFVVHVKQKGSGLETSTLVKVDLDGQNNNDTTLNSLATSLDAVDGIGAKVVAGKLQITADNGDTTFNFSQDSSGTLASLGINTFFSGDSALNIAVNKSLQDDPSKLAASKNGEIGDNQTAIAIANLESAPVAALKGASLKDSYEAMVNGVAGDVATSKTNAEAASAIKDTLTAQREALSGVSLDEEAINLVKQQRAYQGAARFISAVDDMMKTLLAIT